MIRRALVVLAMFMILAVGGVPAGVAAAQGPQPDPIVVRIEDAIRALRTLDTYSFHQVEDVPDFAPAPVITDGIVIRTDDQFRYRSDSTEGGEPRASTVVTPRGEWESHHGSRFAPQRSKYLRTTPGSPHPFDEARLRQIGDGTVTGENLGLEVRDGAPMRHLRLTVTLVDPESDPDGLMLALGGLDGTIDAWVAESDGWLAELITDGLTTRPWGGAGPAPEPVRTRTLVTIGRVNDPTLVVKRPDLARVQPRVPPAGDPGIATTVERAYAALDELQSYRILRSSVLPSIFGTERVTVVNGSRRAELRQDMLGSELGLFATDGDWWTWSDGFGWSRRDGAFFFDGCEGGGCFFADLAQPGDDARPWAATFVRIGEEIVGGVSAIHLRSDAGMEHPLYRTWVPGTWDLWVAKDGGHMLRQTFDGLAFERETVVEGVDDPANVLEIPTTK